MSHFHKAYLICEFSHDTLLRFPVDSGIPKKILYRYKNGKRIKNIRLSGKFLDSFLTNNCNENNVELIFCESKEAAEDLAYSIMSEYVNQFKK